MLNKNKINTATITKKNKEAILGEIEALINDPANKMTQIIEVVCDAIDPTGENGQILFFPLSMWSRPCLTAGTLFDVVKLIKHSIIPTIELSDDIQNATVFLAKLQGIKTHLPSNDKNSQNCLDDMIKDLNNSLQIINNKSFLYTDGNRNSNDDYSNNALKKTLYAYDELVNIVTNHSIMTKEKTKTCIEAIDLILNQNMPIIGLDAILMLIDISLIPQLDNANEGQILSNKLAELYGNKIIPISERTTNMLVKMTDTLAIKIQSLYNINDDTSINNPQTDRANYKI